MKKQVNKFPCLRGVYNLLQKNTMNQEKFRWQLVLYKEIEPDEVIRSDCDAISSWVIWESLSDEFKSA
jgi:hypothetical protein